MFQLSITESARWVHHVARTPGEVPLSGPSEVFAAGLAKISTAGPTEVYIVGPIEVSVAGLGEPITDLPSGGVVSNISGTWETINIDAVGPACATIENYL
ncbi:hypothetical protein VNO77_33793 [Canavalia gladiata]|uniref:Uncharacterized protein n=1 Tax=Canavalia gladiata TaxID=3824 RepID=A0AAN9KD29_CANGL